MFKLPGTENRAFRLLPGSRTHSGFSLVEVLVVSVIAAVLAAVAVPVYTGYINSQREEVARNIAQSAAAAANIYTRRTGAEVDCAHPDCVDLLNIFLSNPDQFEIAIAGRTVTVTDVINAGIVQTSAY